MNLNCLIPLLFLSLVGCSARDTDRRLEEVRSKISDAPAVALAELDSLKTEQLNRPALRAKYALLYSQALAKNFKCPASDSLIRIAVEYYDREGDPHESAMAYYYLGRYRYLRGDWFGAAEAYFTASALVGQTADEYLKGLVKVGIGTIYLEQYGFAEALRYLDEGECHFAVQGGTPRNRAVVAELKAEGYKRLGRVRRADSCYRSAEALYARQNDVEGLMRVKMGYVSVIEKKYGADSAFRYLDSLHRWAVARGIWAADKPSPLYNRWGLLVGLHFSAGNADSVRIYGEKCLTEGQYRSSWALLSCLALLEKVEFSAGNYAKARHYAERYQQMQDSLYGSQYLYFMHAIDEQKQNEILTLMNSRLRERTHDQRAMLFGTGLLIIMVASLLVWGVRRWRRRVRVKVEQAQAEAEALQHSYAQMCSQLALLQQQDEGKDERERQLYKALEERLIGLRDLMTVFQMGKPADFAANFKQYAEVNLHSQYALSELQFVVNRKYHGMIDYLREHYPELNKHDLDLCGLMCLGFSQQGICFMYGYDDVGSFYNRRSRLRRKLQLPTDARIEEFIMDLRRRFEAETEGGAVA